MARKTNFGSIVNSAIKEMAREAARAEKAAIKEHKARQREYERQQRLNQKINKMELACSISGNICNVNSVYLSLRKDYSFFSKINSVDEIRFKVKKDTLTDTIDYLKLGQRNNAIDYLKDETKLEYNEIICIVAAIENNLQEFIRENKGCWFDDQIGEYEFLPVDSLFEIDAYIDHHTAKSEVTVTCLPLAETELISGIDPIAVKNKINKTVGKLNKKWIQQFNKYHLERENHIVENIKKEQQNLLKYVANNGVYAFDYETLKDKSIFISKLPKVSKANLELNDLTDLSDKLISLENTKPTDDDIQYTCWEKLLCHLFLKNMIEKRRQKRFRAAFSKWKKSKKILIKKIKTLKNENQKKEKEYSLAAKQYSDYLKSVEEEKENFIAKQNTHNKAVDVRIEKFKNKDAAEIEEYFKNSVFLSTYPIVWEKEIDLSYNSNNKTIVIDYKLPTIEEIYNVDKINYSVTKNEYNKVLFKDKFLNQTYNDILYQICLRTIYEIFSLDIELNCVNSVTFNGIISAIDGASGKTKTACILSLMTTAENMENIDFINVNAKECFKSLKGIGAAELSSITPIMPIRNIDKNDKRFIDAYQVLDLLNAGTNIAAIGWQDFENLIREVFEKEFSFNGGEVKITQASKDGGVDAIAFDPDPIRGGKIIIQAKRYTNIVGVSAVRDLYGTLMNEGANGGILVTTSDYGADAYEFAKGKPINLLNGNELLGLMKKHGYDAYINIKEARQILKET